jgi:hypothetical protein
MHKAYKKDLTVRQLFFIIHANVYFIATNSIANHTIKSLVWVLKVEKRKQNCRKQLNLVRKEDHRLQLFSPSKVLCAKAYSKEKGT